MVARKFDPQRAASLFSWKDTQDIREEIDRVCPAVVDNNLENPCQTEASRKAVPLDLRIVPFFQRRYEVSLFKASDDYVFAADPSLWPWFSGVTSSQ